MTSSDEDDARERKGPTRRQRMHLTSLLSFIVYRG